jgi:phage tail sheath protein FI
MPNNLSPNVEIRERDFTQIVPSVTSSVGAMVIAAEKGPVNQRVLVTNPNDLESKFGRPSDVNFTHWFTAEAFSKQSDQLWLVRTEDDTKAVPGLTVGVSSTGTTAASGDVVILENTSKKVESFPLDYGDIKEHEAKKDYSLDPDLPASNPLALDNAANNLLDDESYHFYAVGPGSVYEGVSVVVVNAADWATLVELRDELVEAVTQDEIDSIASRYYNGVPATTASPAEELLSNSLIKYDVIFPPTAPSTDWDIDESFLATLVAFEFGPDESDEAILIVFNEFGDPVNQWVFSNQKGKRDEQGNRMFGPDQVNGNNDLIYFYIGNNETSASGVPMVTTRRTFLGFTDYDVANGFDKLTGELPGSGLGDLTGEILKAWQEYFTNPEEIEIDLLIDPDYVDNIKRYLDQICKEIRKDCFAVLNVRKDRILNVTNNKPVSSPYQSMKRYVQNDLNINSSYSAIYGNYFKIYDRFAEKERWVPASGYVSAVMAFTDFSAAQWWAPAGLNRGIISNVVDVAVNPNKGQRDILYYNRINPIVDFVGEGIVIWGQKTLQSKASAFDRINVRRLFLYLEKTIKRFARFYLFEFNDDFTRSRFRGTVNPFLSEVKARRGVFDYLVVCDETNNTPEVIDRNEFRAEILVKPTRVAEFIKLTFTAVGTGVEFNEVVERL